MNWVRWPSRAPRALLIPGIAALAAVAGVSMRTGARSSNFTTPPLHPPQQVLDMQNAFEAVSQKLKQSVVSIRSRQTVQNPFARQGQAPDLSPDNPFRFFQIPQGQNTPQFPQHTYASGSGVIVRSDGWILTNDHVVNGADSVTVRLSDGREFVGKVKPDFRSDLALIKITADNLPSAEFANSDDVRVGQWAIAFGSPFGLNDTMTVGVVSALNREQTIGGGNNGRLYPSLIQSDASINPGNSGGPLVDIYGKVVGINVAIESPTGTNAGVGFAIPSNEASYIMDQLMTRGEVTRGYLGLAPETLTYQESQKAGVDHGVLVRMVEDGTPAAKAGFQVGDIITQYNGQNIKDDAAFRDMVARSKPGDNASAVVLRDGHEMTLHVTLSAAPDLTASAAPAPTSPTPKSRLGIQASDSSDVQVRQQFGIKATVRGAVVASVVPGSPAADAGISAGDIITALDGKPVHSAADLNAVVGGLKQSGTVTAVVRHKEQTILVDIDFG